MAEQRGFVEIVEQPVSRGFRFRYECEGRSAGSIMGQTSNRDNKTFPKIKIHHTNGGPSIVVVSCVTKDDPPRPHPHNLVGKDCQKGVCTVRLNNSDTATFPNIGIQCCRRKDIPKALVDRKDIRVDPFGTGFNYDINSLDLTVVRLCFQVFLKDDHGKFTKVGKPAVSHCIYDKKSKLDLGICRISRQAGCVSGGEEVILLCEKVSKDDIEVVFSEANEEGIMWEARGDFGPQDVHRQYAIVFRTPAYRDCTIRNPVNVNLYLKRPSDGETSEPLEFQYTPENRDPEGVEAKRIRKRLYQDIETSAFGGMRQSGGAMQMGAGFNMAAMNRGASEPQTGRDALRDKLMAKNPGTSHMPHMSGGGYAQSYNPMGATAASSMAQQPGTSAPPMASYDFNSMPGAMGQQPIPQASPLGNLPGNMGNMGNMGTGENTLTQINTDDLAGMTLDANIVKVEDMNIHSGQLDSDQIRNMLFNDPIGLDQLLTDLGEMNDMNGVQDPQLMSQQPDQGAGPHL